MNINGTKSLEMRDLTTWVQQITAEAASRFVTICDLVVGVYVVVSRKGKTCPVVVYDQTEAFCCWAWAAFWACTNSG